MFKCLISLIVGVIVYSPVFAKEKLIFAIDLVRHGDRTPVMPSPGMQKIYSQGEGQLTPRGMRQEYYLGKKFRFLYVKKYHLLPEKYDFKTMSVRSSGIPRTMMSAQSILYGLYPIGTGPKIDSSTDALPNGFQPIPINVILPSEDALLIPNHNKDEYRKLLAKYVFTTQVWMKRDDELKYKYPLWSRVFGIQINNLYDLINISDRLYIERIYNIPLPENLAKSDAETIESAARFAIFYIANNKQLASKVGGELAQTIVKEIKNASQLKTSTKYLLFVAHDSTLDAQLNILGQKINKLTPYAANIKYMLFDNGNAKHTVRVSFNQKPLYIKQCGSVDCDLNKFISVLSK